MKNTFDFLKSRKFWAAVLLALASWLYTDGYITAGLANFLQQLSAIFIGINMTNKIIEKIKPENK